MRLNAIDSGFHSVLGGLGHADPGADGNCVTNVRFPRGWGPRSRPSSYVAARYNNVPRVNSQVAGMAHGKGSSRKRRPVDARIVSAHNDGNPLFGRRSHRAGIVSANIAARRGHARRAGWTAMTWPARVRR